MANADTAINRTLKEEGGFQNNSADSGNFLNGVNYGTKFGITPGAWMRYYNKPIQPDTIRNLTKEQAVPIYEKNYWAKIKGDHIANQSLADLMMFTVVNSGAGQVLNFKKLMNRLSGRKVVAETSVPFTLQEIEILNSLDQEAYFNALKAERENFYRSLVKSKPEKAVFLPGWLRRLNEYQFSSEKKKYLILLAVLLLLALIWWIYSKK